MSGVRPNTFKVVQLNAENLFLYLDDAPLGDLKKMQEKEWQRLSNSTVANKSLVKTLWLAESILDMNADIVCLNEVGGLESLENFTRIFLDNHYVPHLLEGNSDRGIDVGFLVRKDFPHRLELKTNKDRPIQFLYPHERQGDLLDKKPMRASHYFSRDCAELHVFKKDSLDPSLVILLVHLKSKLDPEGIDPQGKERRRAELNTLMQIYREVREQWKAPVIVTGDFNGCARRDQLADEFKEMTNTDLQSVTEIAGLDTEQSSTQVQFTRQGQMNHLQIDYIFISPDLKPYLIPQGVEIYRYRSDLKVTLPMPRTLEQRTYLPSDHYPVVATFQNFLSE